MTDLSTVFAQTANKVCSFAPIYPSVLLPNVDDCLPGSYGTYQNGVWSKTGDISDFGVSFTPADPGSYTGVASWSSQSLKTDSVYFNGSAWIVGEDASGDGKLGVRFTDSSSTLFHVAVGDTYDYSMDLDTLTPLVAAVQNLKNGDSLRFVTRLVTSDALLAFGGQTKSAECIVSGDAQALSDAVAGQVTGALTIAQSNVTAIQVDIAPGSQMIPIGMLLYQVTSKGLVLNLGPE